MKYLIVIPARGGSRGIPLKNIYPLNGKPLLEYTLETIIKAKLQNTDVAVSTDSEKIANVARKYIEIYVVPRPKEISGDRAPTEDALIYTLNEMQKIKGMEYDAVMTIQPTSPLRKANTFREIISQFELKYPEYDAILSLNETRADYWVHTDNVYSRLYKDAPRRRQDRKPLYVENSAFYVTGAQALLETHSVLGHRVNGFEISEIESIDINEPIDLLIAEAYLKKEK